MYDNLCGIEWAHFLVCPIDYNFKKTLGDTNNLIDKSQFLKAISVIDKLSPINFSDKCCGKFSTCFTNFFFVSQTAKMFL